MLYTNGDVLDNPYLLKPYHGIQFAIPDDSYYETQDGLSWGVNPTYAHDWNDSGESEIRLQISLRETPTLAPERRALCRQSYFTQLPFAPADLTCLALPEIIAEKIAPAISGTRRATFMISAALQPDHWTMS